MSDDVRRICIVGAGPKGLYCLERLGVELARTAPSVLPEIHIFEPHAAPGAGPVYDPTQPEYLRLNFANDKIDAWSRDDGPALTAVRQSFLEFLRAEHPSHADPGGYAPRALVGEYLRTVFSAVLGAVREMTTVEIHPEAVQRISPLDDRFEIATAARTLVCDDVLVATGHWSRRGGSLLGEPGRSLGPYPIDRPGGVGDIEPGSAVAVRGMGLTAIDVALALTEGRGGSFEEVDHRPGRLRYTGTPLSPRVILPYSRTGRPMVPKDHPHFGPAIAALDPVADECANGIASLSGDAASVLAGLERYIVDIAARALSLATGDSPADAERIAAHLDELFERRPLPATDVAAELAHGVDVAYGQRAPGPDWALGAAWKALYPAIVDLFATRRLDPVWPRFERLAAEMERVAFGPPAENAARLLALVDAGVVDLSIAAGSKLHEREDGLALELDNKIRPVDVVVNAVLAPHGANPDPSPLVASLLESGLARPMPSAPGIEVLEDGTCVGRSGSRTRGLAMVGRPTEGCLLGNDTLSRTLHDLPDRWARAAVRRLASTKEPMYR